MTDLAIAIALNVRARFREQGCFNSSVFRCKFNQRIYLNVLSASDDRRPMERITTETCYLRLMPYPRTVVIHSNILRYIHTDPAIDILQTKIRKLIDHEHLLPEDKPIV